MLSIDIKDNDIMMHTNLFVVVRMMNVVFWREETTNYSQKRVARGVIVSVKYIRQSITISLFSSFVFIRTNNENPTHHPSWFCF